MYIVPGKTWLRHAICNAVESHNRASKRKSADILKVGPYKLDMAAALEHLARTHGIPTTYVDLTHDARAKCVRTANAASLIGPMPCMQKYQEGIKYIITLTDYFSKWAEAAALPKKVESNIAHAQKNQREV